MTTIYKYYSAGDQISLGEVNKNNLTLVIGKGIIDCKIIVRWSNKVSVRVPITQAVELFVAGENEKPEVQAIIKCLQDNILEYNQIEFINKYNQSLVA